MEQLAAPAESPFSDETLVARVRAGAPALFEVLMRRHNQRLYRAIRSVLRDEAEIEDVMQQAYLAAFSHLEQFVGDAKFSTWLLRIGINEALGRVRKRARLVPLDDDEAGLMAPKDQTQPNPEDGAANRELAALLERRIDQLPDGYREVLVLRLVEGLDTEATARILDLSQEAVKQRLHRARALVQASLVRDLDATAPRAFPFHASRCDRVVAGVLRAIGSG